MGEADKSYLITLATLTDKRWHLPVLLTPPSLPDRQPAKDPSPPPAIPSTEPRTKPGSQGQLLLAPLGLMVRQRLLRGPDPLPSHPTTPHHCYQMVAATIPHQPLSAEAPHPQAPLSDSTAKCSACNGERSVLSTPGHPRGQHCSDFGQGEGLLAPHSCLEKFPISFHILPHPA